MKETLKEFLDNKSNKPLKKFCFDAEPAVTQLEADLSTAQEAFGEVVQYFGENPKLCQPNSVFPVLQRFVAGFQVSRIICIIFKYVNATTNRIRVCTQSHV